MARRAAMQTWIDLLGKTELDAPFKKALAAVGRTAVPRMARGDTSVIFDLEGHGMSVEMRGDRKQPLVLTSVDAYFVRKKNQDLYRGALPYGVTADMTRTELQKLLGKPGWQAEDFPAESWVRGPVEVIVAYTEDSKMTHFNVKLVR